MSALADARACERFVPALEAVALGRSGNQVQGPRSKVTIAERP
jgi:hypothetical protein